MSLYEEIRNIFTLPNAREDWEEYRDFITGMLKANATRTEVDFSKGISFALDAKPSILFIGAGRCNDIDVEALTEDFSQITLADSDIAFLQSAGDFDERVVDKREINLLGLSEDDMIRFTTYASDGYRIMKEVGFTDDTFVSYEEYLIAGLSELYKKAEPENMELKDREFDYIFLSGVYSQLTAYPAYLLEILEAHIKRDAGRSIKFDFAREFLERINYDFIPRINNRLYKGAKISLIIGNELRSQSDSQQSRITGAWNAIMDIRHRFSDVSELRTDWTFDKERDITYEMIFQKIDIE